MVVGVLKLEIYMEENRSLKDKRRLIRSLIQRVKSKFINISISEVDHLDSWKKTVLGITLISNETSFVNSVLDQVLIFIRDSNSCRIIATEIEVIRF